MRCINYPASIPKSQANSATYLEHVRCPEVVCVRQVPAGPGALPRPVRRQVPRQGPRSRRNPGEQSDGRSDSVTYFPRHLRAPGAFKIACLCLLPALCGAPVWPDFAVAIPPHDFPGRHPRSHFRQWRQSVHRSRRQRVRQRHRCFGVLARMAASGQIAWRGRRSATGRDLPAAHRSPTAGNAALLPLSFPLPTAARGQTQPITPLFPGRIGAVIARTGKPSHATRSPRLTDSEPPRLGDV